MTQLDPWRQALHAALIGRATALWRLKHSAIVGIEMLQEILVTRVDLDGKRP
jgi:hypothetical protein